VDKFSKTRLVENTELIISGDHLTMYSARVEFTLARNLTLTFPFRKQDEHWAFAQSKTLSYFDVPPTILKAMNIEYSPPFPFGADIFGEKSGSPPTADDRKLIYRITSGELTFGGVWCKSRPGFCSGLES
jgi:phosphoglycerol transferase MdoB-like AlkP superfamily enzyme